MEVGSRVCDLLEAFPPFESNEIGLLDLPNELISIIAGYLVYADLLSLRTVKNRLIRNGIHHVWVSAIIPGTSSNYSS